MPPRLVALALASLTLLAGCAEKAPDAPDDDGGGTTPPPSGGDGWPEACTDETAAPADGRMLGGDYCLTFRTTLGAFTVELWEDKAPVTAANFLQYAEDGHYDNTVFHRVAVKPVPFVIQGGGFAAPFEGASSQKETRPGIPIEIWPGAHNARGTLAMARVGQDRGPNAAVDSNTAQFFVNLADNSNLDSGYTVFGAVVRGMETVDAIAAVPTGERAGFGDVPREDVVVQEVEILRPDAPAEPSLLAYGGASYGARPGGTLSVALFLRNVGGERLDTELSATAPEGATVEFPVKPATLSAGWGGVVVAEVTFPESFAGGEVTITATGPGGSDSVALDVATVAADAPVAGAENPSVAVTYLGLLDNGMIFDTNLAGVARLGVPVSAKFREHPDPFAFEIGAGQVIPGFEKAVEGLAVGETRAVRLTPEEGYRDGVHRTFQMTLLEAS